MKSFGALFDHECPYKPYPPQNLVLYTLTTVSGGDSPDLASPKYTGPVRVRTRHSDQSCLSLAGRKKCPKHISIFLSNCFGFDIFYISLEISSEIEISLEISSEIAISLEISSEFPHFA